MKRFLLSSALVLGLSGSLAFAQMATPGPDQQAPASGPQAPMHKHKNPRKEAAKLSRELNLTPDQTVKAEPILRDREQKIAALRSDTTLDSKSMHKQMHAIQKSTDEQLAGVLTPDQMTQLRDMQHKHKGGRHGAPPPDGSAPPAPPTA